MIVAPVVHCLVRISTLLLHGASIIALNQTRVVMMCVLSARVLISILVGVGVTEVTIMTRTDEIVSVDSSSAEV